MTDPLRFFHDRRVILCDGIIHREGYEWPCRKVAVSAALEPDGDSWYPTCVHHTRKATAVPIRALLYEAWREGHQATPGISNPYDGDPS